MPIVEAETGDEATEQAEPEATEPGSGDERAAAVENYKNRSPNSVLPTTDRCYFDHDEIAPLCCRLVARQLDSDGSPVNLPLSSPCSSPAANSSGGT